MIGVFCFEATWRGWSRVQLEGELRELRDLGIEAIATETVEPPHELIRAGREAGLRTFVSVPCFSAHGWPELVAGMDLQPIQADGRPRRQMEWYTGLVPTHGGYVRGLLARIRRIARARPDGVVLDFIRWPLHWELELRVGASEPGESSFDRRSIRAFAGWLRERGIHREGRLDAAALTGPLRTEWTAFKCEVISRVACRAAEVVRSVDRGIRVGAFIVPGTEAQRRRLLGQDVASLGACLDVLLPMTYHGILHRPVGFVADVTQDVSERSGVETLPVVQVTADPAVAGPWDWGRDVSPDELGRAIGAALRAAPGAFLFPLEGLDAPRREVLSRGLEGRSSGLSGGASLVGRDKAPLDRAGRPRPA